MTNQKPTPSNAGLSLRKATTRKLSTAPVVTDIVDSAERAPALLEIGELEVLLVEKSPTRLGQRKGNVRHHILVQLWSRGTSARWNAEHVLSLQRSEALRRGDHYKVLA